MGPTDRCCFSSRQPEIDWHYKTYEPPSLHWHWQCPTTKGWPGWVDRSYVLRPWEKRYVLNPALNHSNRKSQDVLECCPRLMYGKRSWIRSVFQTDGTQKLRRSGCVLIKGTRTSRHSVKQRSAWQKCWWPGCRRFWSRLYRTLRYSQMQQLLF